MTFKTKQEIADLAFALNHICDDVVSYALGDADTKDAAKRVLRMNMETTPYVKRMADKIKEYYRELPIKELSDAFFEMIEEDVEK